MNSLARRIFCFALLVLVAGLPVMASADPPPGSTSGTGSDGGFNVQTTRGNHGREHAARGSRVKYYDCGPIGGALPRGANEDACNVVRIACAVGPGDGQDAQPPSTSQAAVTTGADGRKQTAANCDVAPAVPQVTPELAAAEARKLLPHPKIGTGPRGTTLVNIETVMWVGIDGRLGLGAVRLLGHRVELRASIVVVRWEFGDGSVDHRRSPDRPYSDRHPCRTRECPYYYGHLYEHVGTVTVRARLSWRGEFRVDGGEWVPIAGEVTADAQPTRLRIKQARAVLVPNPGDS